MHSHRLSCKLMNLKSYHKFWHYVDMHVPGNVACLAHSTLCMHAFRVCHVDDESPAMLDKHRVEQFT